jgi:hypothetical protein
MTQKKVTTITIAIALAFVTTFTVATVFTTPVYAYHEQYWRDRGIGLMILTRMV